MKKLLPFLLCLLAALGCSAGAPFEDDSIPDEPVGSVQQSLLSCPRPTGSSGSQSTPILGYITGVQVNATYPFMLDVVYTYNDPGTYGPPVTGYVDFGYGQAAFAGSGWSGSKITSMQVRTPNSTGCSYGTNYYCWYINGSHALTMDQRVSNLFSSSGSGVQTYGIGITKIRGYGNIDPQKLKLYYDDASSIASHTWTALGPKLTECSDPD